MMLKTLFFTFIFMFSLISAAQKPFKAFDVVRDVDLPPFTIQQEFKGELKLFPLTSQHLVVAGNYRDFINSEVLRAYGKRLELADKYLTDGTLQEWTYRFWYNFATADVATKYMQIIADNFQNPAYFSFKTNDRTIAIESMGYWINAVGCRRTPHVLRPGFQLVSSAELVPFAYIKLAEPLKNGDQLTVSTKNNESLSFTYSDDSTLSRAIKVNQVGYAADAEEKYAYFGQWLGSAGALPTNQWQDKPFYLVDEKSNQKVFTGTIKLRSEIQTIKNKGNELVLDGEIVMELDFSEFSTPGQYHIQIPGAGRSWDFVIGDNAVGRAFYVQMRGLFHQRSGIAKPPELTGWPFGADHKSSWRGGFAPNDRHYDQFITDSTGNTVDIRHFDMVAATATDEELTNVYGGWWDAGDFDRRTYHFQVVDELLSVYLLWPDNFSDNQLDLPESGNGIPDIIDEAAWGVDVWRRAQNEAGGVGCWLEATSHPQNPDPVKDVQRYYLALPTRESTLQYCAHAAKLARAYKKCGAETQAALFYQSAKKAWAYAMNPANRVIKSFEHKKYGTLTYKEPEELPEKMKFKAALNLFMYQADPELENYLDNVDFDKLLEQIKNEENAYFICELAENDELFFIYSTKFRKLVRIYADNFIKTQEKLAYRNINWNFDSPYFTSMAWGNGLPFVKGSYYIVAYGATGNPKYRNAALLLMDWMHGANPMGRSMTTGLGKVYPVRILSLPMWAKNGLMNDPIPGITPYTFSGRNNYMAASRIFVLNFEERKDHKFDGAYANLLPKNQGGSEKLSVKDCYSKLFELLPLYRRFANLEGDAVEQNEFTVWETIAPAAAAYGALLPPNWKPDPTWKKLQPQPLDDLEGYIFLP